MRPFWPAKAISPRYYRHNTEISPQFSYHQNNTVVTPKYHCHITVRNTGVAYGFRANHDLRIPKLQKVSTCIRLPSWQRVDEGAEIVAIHSLPQSWGTGLGHAMMAEALKQIGDGIVFLWAFRENKRARRFYEKHGFRWDGSERISEFDGAMEVRYVRN